MITLPSLTATLSSNVLFMAFAPSCSRREGALTASPLTISVLARPESPFSPIFHRFGKAGRQSRVGAGFLERLGVKGGFPMLDILRRIF